MKLGLQLTAFIEFIKPGGIIDNLEPFLEATSDFLTFLSFNGSKPDWTREYVFFIHHDTRDLGHFQFMLLKLFGYTKLGCTIDSRMVVVASQLVSQVGQYLRCQNGGRPRRVSREHLAIC